MVDDSLLDQLGGKPVLERVHRNFYDKIYSHPWLKLYFAEVDQKVIESQQTDFMISNMGGGKVYSGALPKNAHRHIFITNELFEVRTELLKASLVECKIPGDLAERWLRIDQAFKNSLVKKELQDCEKRFFTDEIVQFPKP